MKAVRKQVTFDLDTNALQIYYPTQNWRNAYEIIKSHMIRNGFVWQQGSVYVSKKAMTAISVANILEELVNKNPWLNVCMRDCRQANIGKEHSANYLFDKTAKIPKREDVEFNKHLSKDGTPEENSPAIVGLDVYIAEIEKANQEQGNANEKSAFSLNNTKEIER